MSVDDRLRSGMGANAMSFQPALESGLDEVRGRGRRRRARRTALAGGLVGAASAAIVGVAWLLGPPGEPPPATPSPSTTSELFGRYRADVTRPAALSGQWVLEFERNGTVLVTPPAGYPGVGSGTLFTADATTLRTNIFAQDVCPDLGNGGYSWTRAGEHLVLAASNERCTARRRFFTGNDWVEVFGP